MKIAIDLQSCQSGSRYGGIGRYSIELAKAMVRRRSGHTFTIVLSDANPAGVAYVKEAFVDLLPADRIRVFSVPKQVSELTNHATKVRSAELIRERFLAELAPDFVHVSSLFEGLLEDVVTSVGEVFPAARTAVTLYDLIPLVQRERYLGDPKAAKHYLAKIEHLRRAGLLLAISDFSRLEACELLEIDPANVVNISSAADSRFRPVSLSEREARELKQRYGIAKKFLMYTSSFDQRKNQAGLIRAFGLLPTSARAGYQLVIVGNGWDGMYQQLRTVAEHAGLGKGELVFAGHVSDADLLPLYNLCDLFVFPSMAEGFGLPVLEAMSCGIPTVCSNTTSLPEVIGMKAATFDPADPRSIAATMGRALTDLPFRQMLRAHGLERAKLFSWDESARRAIEAFENLHERLSLKRRAVVAADQSWSSVFDRFKAIPGIGQVPDAALRDFARCLSVNSIELRSARSIDSGEKSGLRMGWVSTWNKRCGIASYSRFLLDHWPSETSIFGQYADWTTRTDEPNVIRCWDSGGNDDLNHLVSCVLSANLDAVIIQFNYGFFSFPAFNALLNQLIDGGLRVFVTFHSTHDTTVPKKSLSELATALKRCAGLIAHTLRDTEALAKWDLKDNVHLLPQGVIETGPVSHRTTASNGVRTVATYGFALPHKGLNEMVAAVAILCRNAQKPTKLLMVNAEYPDPQSAATLQELRAAISAANLDDAVTVASDYLDESDSIALLRKADLVVFGYQNTGESSSAAVRMGLASGTPVAVTPLHIFDDVRNCTFALPGTAAEDIAAGIDHIFSELEKNTVVATSTESNAARWRSAHAISKLSKELFLIVSRPMRNAGEFEYELEPDYDLSATQSSLRFEASDSVLKTVVGILEDGRLVTTSRQGQFLYGPFINVAPGEYRITITGSCTGTGQATMDICAKLGTLILFERAVTAEDSPELIAAATFVVPKGGVTNLEVRILVDRDIDMRMEALELSYI